jgi:hypothetical protein
MECCCLPNRLASTSIAGDGLREEIAPAVFCQLAGEKAAFASELYGLLVEVVHELVDERKRNEFDLVGWQRDFTDEDIPASVDAPFGFGG